MSTERYQRRVERGERGAALLEFALIFPIFMTLALGMFSGGQAYNRKITMTNAAREGARYGATLDPTGFTAPYPATTPSSDHGLDQWLFEVMDVVQQNAEGELDAGTEALGICVAYVNPSGPNHGPPGDPANDTAGHTLNRDNTGSSYGTSGPTAECFTDNLASTDQRVQVELTRKSDIQLLFFSIPVTLTSRSVMRFEVQ